MTYQETIDFLFNIRLFGQKLGLDTMGELLRRLNEPHQSLRFLHIAGTNGKGSVAAMLEAVLTRAGYRTGMYTSPHLVSFCERFRIDQQPIAESDVVRYVERLRPLLVEIGQTPPFRPPTFFEVVTAMALEYFREHQVEIVIWETGLGGRLDATNVVTPLVSVITSIGYDHMQYLGETIEEIAAEKCGIIKDGRPVVTSATDGAVLPVIERTCQARGSPLTAVPRVVEINHAIRTAAGQQFRIRTADRDYGTIEIPLLGEHQALNCATALVALEASQLPVSPAVVREGLLRTFWPGRFQIAREHPTMILDGAHNPAAAEHLAAAIRQYFPGRSCSLILGILRDKDYAGVCRVLAPLATRIWCVPVNSERTGDPRMLAELCRQANPSAAVVCCPGVAEAHARAVAEPGDIVVITGSLFLVGEAMQRLGLSPMKSAVSEKELVLQ